MELLGNSNEVPLAVFDEAITMHNQTKLIALYCAFISMSAYYGTLIVCGTYNVDGLFQLEQIISLSF